MLVVYIAVQFTVNLLIIIDIINVHIKNVKNVKNVKKIYKNVCKRLIKKLCKNLHLFTQVTSPNLCDVGALQQVSKIFCNMGYVTNQNQ